MARSSSPWSRSPAVRRRPVARRPRAPRHRPGLGAPPSAAPSAAAGKVAWERVNLGFVSAYILSRAGEAAIVDTGVAGSEERHRRVAQGDRPRLAGGRPRDRHPHASRPRRQRGHGDDQRGQRDRLSATPDIGAFATPRPFTTVADGDHVFGLRIVGDARAYAGPHRGRRGRRPAGRRRRRSSSRTACCRVPTRTTRWTCRPPSCRSRRWRALAFETLLVGHGDPIPTGASAEMAKVAAALLTFRKGRSRRSPGPGNGRRPADMPRPR